MSGLLVNEPFIAVFPSLIRTLGDVESALLLQFIAFAADDADLFTATYDELADAIGIPKRTIERRIKDLSDAGYLLVGRTSRFDATRTYQVVRTHPNLIFGGVDPAKMAGSDAAKMAGSLSSKNSKKKEPSGEPEGWVEWWNHYPRKTDKGHALTAYEKALTLTTPEVLLAALIRQRPALMKNSNRYCPYPATWLNGCRWEDRDHLEIATNESNNMKGIR